jgi:hypothetical protein
LASQRSSQLSI